MQVAQSVFYVAALACKLLVIVKVPQVLGAVNGVAGGLVGKVPQALGGTTSVGRWWQQMRSRKLTGARHRGWASAPASLAMAMRCLQGLIVANLVSPTCVTLDLVQCGMVHSAQQWSPFLHTRGFGLMLHLMAAGVVARRCFCLGARPRARYACGCSSLVRLGVDPPRAHYAQLVGAVRMHHIDRPVLRAGATCGWCQ